MGVLRIGFLNLFIYFCCVFLYSVPNVSGQNNMCFNCTDLIDCRASKHYLKYGYKEDKGKVVPRKPGDASDPLMDKCLDDGYTIKETLKGTVCSGSSDGFCHAIGEATTNFSISYTHCGNCYIECDCYNQENGNDRREGPIILTMFLAAFYTLI
ncbi:PREDICTED: uncharacterized protein LOC108609901 [Drosophila arizonae]|uniref:Uncharacterized protein LOC108609901 n=1 Tax=Drosophila arizonae TaxID=7263 RepID=A0ABM1NQD1_DROAR|nr:PREDICTED: uncharacterized protein LOC108609901 [Drosophila arizonae]